MDAPALGRYLRESREARELTLDDAVQKLHIRKPMLEAFERGEFQVGDSPVQTRGMLRNYARFLQLDEERVLQFYASSLDNDRRKRRRGRKKKTQEIAAPRKITDTPPAFPAVKLEHTAATGGGILAFLRVLAMLLVSAASIAIIAFVVYDTIFNENSVTEVADADLVPQLVQSSTPTQTYTPTWTPPPTRSAEENNALNIVSGVQIILEMTQRSWVQITVDDVEQYTGILEPNERQRYDANQSVEISAANAAALAINFNGLDQPAFGERGERVVLTFTQNGVFADGESALSPTPTATFTPIPTTTPIPFEAPTETETQTATPAQAAVNITPSPTPLFFDDSNVEPSMTPRPTITPLFGDTTTSATTNNDAQSTIANASPVAIETTTPIATATQTTTPSPTIRPTSDAVLPLRATPSNPTPTKEG